MLWRCYCPRPDSLNSTFLGNNIKNLYYIIAYETEGFQIKVPMGKISLLYIQYHKSSTNNLDIFIVRRKVTVNVSVFT